jgi:hypothetical protein
LSYEVELLGLAVIFYLYDSSLLLYSNEGILTVDGARRWSAPPGWVGLVFAGRRLCMLNPFTPHHPAFRLSWNFATLEPATVDLSWPARAQALEGLAPLTVTAGVALFILLPAGLLSSLGELLVVPAVILLYASIGAALIQLHRRKILASAGRKRLIGFAFECLACPPFGVNMIRRLTLAERISEPLPLAGARLLIGERWGVLRDQCVLRLDDAIRSAADNPDELKALDAQRERLKALNHRS